MSDPDDRPTILVVDDEPLNIELLAGVLEADGDVLFATNGLEAIEIARREHPDIVLLDVEMPDMDGFEVCRRFKADPTIANIPVVFVTAHDSNAKAEAGIAIGGADFLTKPVGIAITRARVRTHVALKRYRDQERSAGR